MTRGRKNRNYRGNAPQGDGWTKVGLKAPDKEGVCWNVFVGPRNDSGWSTIKVVANGNAVNKGNYWLSWNGEAFAKSRDWGTMEDHRPELAKSVWYVLQRLEMDKGGLVTVQKECQIDTISAHVGQSAPKIEHRLSQFPEVPGSVS